MDTVARRLAWRWGLVTTAVTAVVTYGVAALLHHDLAQTTVSFVIFAGLFGGTAAFLGNEVAAWRRCPRCGHQQEARPGVCPSCGYDVRSRPRYVCDEGHAAFEPGLCDCGRRRHEWQPPDVSGRVLRMVWFGVALLVVLLVAGLLLNQGR